MDAAQHLIRRKTKLADKQASILRPAWQSVSTHPDVADLWQACFEAVPQNNSTILLSRMLTLDAVIRHRSPILARFYGRHLFGALFQMLIYSIVRVHHRATHEEATAFVARHLPPMKTERVMPDNPLTIGLDGSITIPADTGEAQLLRHIQEIRDYCRSCRPEGRSGRPVRLDMEQSLRAAALHKEGAKWQQIARELGIAFDPYDKRSKDRAYKAVWRLIDRGNLQQ